jgi:signal transduction histidine kinase
MTDATVLIVDDDRTIVRLCQRLLERASFHVLVATDPLDALKALEAQKVDLLLSDIRMPIMDGFELITRAKQFQPELPVLVMTGYGSIENAIQALHRGVDGLILKPFENSVELVQTVQRVLAESRQKREAARLQALRPLFDVTERLLAETSLQPLERLILSAVTGLFQANFAGVFRMVDAADGLETIRTTDDFASAAVREMRQQLIHLAVENGIPSIINAGRNDVPGPVQSKIDALNWGSLLAASVRRNNNQFVFCASRPAGGPSFAEADLEMFVILARQAAVALENARLYSDLKDYVRQVEESQRALVQAEKMAAVGRLMATMAHEINNPLQSVRNCVHLSARREIEESQRFKYLEMTNSELTRLVNVVRRMLDFYRPGGVEKEPVDIGALIEQVLALLAAQLREHDIQVHYQPAGVKQCVYVVRDQMQQVFFNLLLNAMDALVEAGSDGSNGQPAARDVWIDVLQTDTQICVFIEDSGPGIPADMQEQVFEPFVSTKRDGTGLGLSVSYGIMERHRGRLTIVPPRYRQGACFEITLPVEIEGEDGENINC